MLFNLHDFECFGVFPLRFVSSFRPLWSEKKLDMILIFLNLLRLVLCPIMWSIFEIVPCAFDKNVYFGSLGWKALYISVKSIWSWAWFNATVFLLTFGLKDLFIFDSGLLKSPTIIVLLSISFLKSSRFSLCIWVLLYWMHIYLQCLCLLDGFFPWVLWSDLLGLSLWPLFWSLFCLIWVLVPQLFFFLFICMEYLFPALHFAGISLGRSV